jgi:hypothetical protein
MLRAGPALGLAVFFADRLAGRAAVAAIFSTRATIF